MVVAGTNHIILDAYNANPSSMLVAIKNIAQLPAKNKVVLLGGMMELGETSLHQLSPGSLERHTLTQKRLKPTIQLQGLDQVRE